MHSPPLSPVTFWHTKTLLSSTELRESFMLLHDNFYTFAWKCSRYFVKLSHDFVTVEGSVSHDDVIVWLFYVIFFTFLRNNFHIVTWNYHVDNFPSIQENDAPHVNQWPGYDYDQTDYRKYSTTPVVSFSVAAIGSRTVQQLDGNEERKKKTVFSECDHLVPVLLVLPRFTQPSCDSPEAKNGKNSLEFAQL